MLIVRAANPISFDYLLEDVKNLRPAETMVETRVDSATHPHPRCLEGILEFSVHLKLAFCH